MLFCCRNLIMTYQTLTKTSQWRRSSSPHQTKNFSRQWIKKSSMASPSPAPRQNTKIRNPESAREISGKRSAVNPWSPMVAICDPNRIYVSSILLCITDCVVLCRICVRTYGIWGFCIRGHLKNWLMDKLYSITLMAWC